MFEQVVIAIGEVFKTGLGFLPRAVGIESEEGKGEFYAVVIKLCGEEIHLWLSVLYYSFRVLISVIYVMRKSSCVVKTFGEHRPLSVFFIKIISDKLAAELIYRVTKQNTLAAVPRYDIAEPLVVGCAGAVLCPGGRCEPALVNSTALETKHVVLIGVKFNALSWTAEATGNPGRFKSKRPRPQAIVSLQA